MSMVTAEDLVSHVAAHAGVAPPTADFALRTVLAGIGTRLSPSARDVLVDELPSPFAALVNEETAALPIEERLLAKASNLGHARELAASACRVLAEELSNEALQALRDALPPSIAAFVETPAPAREHARSDRSRGLARGHFGSAHPLHEARVERAHAGSVAAANPHDDTKLSSSPGTTQERLHETLAEGHPLTHPLTKSS